ncbi:FtsW/RodA/SpoVE family cell cycle protein [Sporobacter termitidis]|uniref:FtsW/RodA/SpoVE family cell cycle protein n=1 Tax=Sporobacter termitidis TaxID=44749 RepID=UPI001FA88AC8|nr:FtsW/RodA/SpoVE family cell cycle protein [Sporobacter termitidis]
MIIVWRTVKSLLMDDYDYEAWGYLSLPNGARITLNHWENIIGRSKASDVYMEYPTLSRSHAALIRDNKGRWQLYDLGSKSGVLLNGVPVRNRAPVKNGDILTMGGVELVFFTISHPEQAAIEHERKRPGKVVRPFGTLLFLMLFQVALGLQLCISMDAALPPAVPVSFVALIALTWLCYILTRTLRRVAFEVETLAFFLCSVGLAVTASAAPGDLYKQIGFILAGICLYFLIGWFLRDLGRAVKLRWPIAVAGLVLLAVNLLLSRSIFGAKNWLTIGGVTFQPSEFVKLAFVFAGAATLDRLFARRNLILFIAYSGICVMALAVMGDFGTALVFFVAYLTISFIRSGDLATVFLSIGGAGLAGFMAITLKAHVAERFATWGHVWQEVNGSGFQQTRTMMASASGGLFGVGAGNGWFKHIFAADTDMVFGMVSEELGLIVGVVVIFALLALAFNAVRAASTARSSFYVIGAGASAAILLFQMILNVFGSLDILPFTGVTLPFVSKGGSSLIACWGLLAFIKAIDTRKNASFVVRTPNNVSKKEQRLQEKQRPEEDDDDGEFDDFEPEFDDDDYDFSRDFDFGDVFDKDDE